ncbi:site-specific integrase [Mesorhizobium sp. M0306]|uniref:site-specific integrase n=1 Tax=Mesorhizobium sp. M0306 TaxID=2956932 RepID=UPI00333CC3EB
MTSAMIAAFRDQRLQVVKAGTVRRELALLRHCFEIARREWGIPIGRNPFLDMKMPSVANSRERRLEAADHKALQIALNRSKAWYLAPMIELAIETGMRRGELLALQWRYVAIDQRIATLPNTKNGRSRKVPLTARAVTIISALPRKGEHLFSVKPGAFGEAWERLVKRASLGDLRFHDLRHEAISRFFEMGLSLPEVALISGHRDYRMLLRYTHIRAEDVAKKLQ